MKDYSNFEEIELFYSVYGSVIIETNTTSTTYYTDSSGYHDLVELECDYQGVIINLKRTNEGDSFEMFFPERYVTSDIRKALKIAIKAYKKDVLNGSRKEDATIYFREYFDLYPEMFL